MKGLHKSFDGQLVRLGPKDHEVLGKYVLVRVVDMAEVPLDAYEFDCDLTFCALLLHPAGRILHTYGGRNEMSPDSHLSVKSLLAVMEKTLEEVTPHSARQPARVADPGSTVEDLPPMARRIEAGKRPDCIHCHTVNDVRTEWARERGDWKQDQAFRWPDPIQIGLRLEKEEQSVVREVTPRSAAAKAGLKAGDRLLRIGSQRILTYGDVARSIRGTPPYELVWERDEKETKRKLRPPKGWRRPTPEVFAWRSSKWPLSPKPGFGGPRLSGDELARLGLSRDRFAFRVGYVVTWGRNCHTGLNARKAGIRKGDVVLRVAGKSDFESVAHFHAWFRMTRKVEETVTIEILRAGDRKTVQLKTVP